jgi:hypothetical protein
MPNLDPPAPSCQTCDNYRPIANRCLVEAIEVYELGYYCPKHQPIQIRKAPNHDNH